MTFGKIAALLALPLAIVTMGQSECTPTPGDDPVDCACDSAFSVGDKVQATVATPSGAIDIAVGATGTVVCGGEGLPPLLIQWDDWQQGHDGNGNCDCPADASASEQSGWFVECTEIRVAP